MQLSSPGIRDPFSSLSHLLGAALSIAAMIAMLLNTPSTDKLLYQISYLSFGLSACFMFAASAIYHFPTGSISLIRHLKRVDHIAIYVMIAGSYTPYLLIGLDAPHGLNLLAVIWVVAVAGTLKKIFWLNAPRWLSTALYLAMGWVSLVIYDDLGKNLSEQALFWLVAGGVTYSLGALIYAVKKPNLHRQFGFHELWHVFVLGGAACHAISIGMYL
jgi:hemolysin III